MKQKHVKSREASRSTGTWRPFNDFRKLIRKEPITQEDLKVHEYKELDYHTIQKEAELLRAKNIERYGEKERRDEIMPRTYLLWELVVDTILYRFNNAEANRFKDQETFDKTVNLVITQIKRWGTVAGEEELARLGDLDNLKVCCDLGIVGLPAELKLRPATPLHMTIVGFFFQDPGLALLKEPYTEMHSFSDFIQTNTFISPAHNLMAVHYYYTNHVDPDSQEGDSALFLDKELTRCHTTYFSSVNPHLTDKKTLIRSFGQAFRRAAIKLHPDRNSDPNLFQQMHDLNICREILAKFIEQGK